MNTITSNQFADGFGPVSLARFAAAPGSSHVFRVQHDLLSRTMDNIVFEAHSYSAGTAEEMAERALAVANAMTTLRSMLETHQVLESGLMHKVLGVDPRQRLAAEQFEREAASAITEFEKLLMDFGAPSQILTHMADFSSRAGSTFARLKERFKAEERDLFPAFDRMTAGADVSDLPVVAAIEVSGSDSAGDLGSKEALVHEESLTHDPAAPNLTASSVVALEEIEPGPAGDADAVGLRDAAPALAPLDLAPAGTAGEGAESLEQPAATAPAATPARAGDAAEDSAANTPLNTPANTPFELRLVGSDA